MNEQQPYEKHLAEKFQQLPLPDVESNWLRMKSLLDKEMPRGGAYWKWITGVGIILIMLFGSTWFFINKNEPATAGNKPPNASSEPGKQNAAVHRPEAKGLSKNDNPNQKLNSPPSSESNNLKKSNPTLKGITHKTTVIETTSPNSTGSKDQLSVNRNEQKRLPVSKQPGTLSNTNEEISEEYFPSVNSKDNSNGQLNSGQQLQVDPQAPSIGNRTDKIKKGTNQELELRTSSSTFITNNVESGVDVAKVVGDSIDNRYYTNLFPERKSQPEINREKNKSARAKDIRLSQNKNVALGFSLPLGFPLGDQKPGSYNINAKPNVISDFVPVPHMQYHINNKVYLQTELQLMNPQYIQPVLLSQQKNEVQSTNTVYYNSVYARKLYYFNLPVGIHYSPFQHFYLGTGLQFSSLVSGVALHEQTKSTIGSNRYDLVSQRYTKFKNDTLSARIDNNEFRLMLDANYYWRKFTVGLRYNQALSNYVSFRLNSSSPLFQDKNKSLQFYLRYNLWENHKKPPLINTGKK
jgi:hypothetical protein